MTRETSLEWRHLDPNAGLLSQLCLQMGVKGVQVDQVLSIDRLCEQRSVYGIIVFLRQNVPVSGSNNSNSTATPMNEEHNRIYFANQVVNDAYCMHALLSILLNCDRIDIGSTLTEYKVFTNDFPSMVKGLSLTNSHALRKAHNSVGRLWPKQPSPRPVYHYVSYLPFEGTLLELDGFKKTPSSLGPCTDKNWLRLVQSELSQKIGRYQDGTWSIWSVMEDRRQVYQQILVAKLALKDEIEAQLKDHYPEWMDTVEVQRWEDEYQHAVMNDEYNRRGKKVAADWTAISPPPSAQLIPTPQPRNFNDAIDLWLQVKDDILQLYTKFGKEDKKQGAYQNDAIRIQHDYGPFVHAYLEEQGILPRPGSQH